MYSFQTKAQREAARVADDQQREHDERHDRRETVLIYLLLALFSVLTLGASYILERPVDPGSNSIVRDFFGVFLKHLGVAGLIAIILTITFERLSSDEFRKLAIRERNLAKSDVFYYVYGYGIPEAIRNEINTKILKSVFVRNNMDLFYTLRKVEVDGRDFMQVRLVVKYQVQNLTTVRQPFDIIGGLEKPFRPSLKPYVKIANLHVGVDGHTIISMDEQELRANGAIQTNDEIEVGLLLKQAVLIEPQKTANVRLEYHTITHYEGGYDYFTLWQHTCGLNVSVRVPNNDVIVVLRDFSGEELPVEEAEHDPVSGAYHWYSPTPMLVNQGVYLAWIPHELAETVADNQAIT